LENELLKANDSLFDSNQTLDELQKEIQVKDEKIYNFECSVSQSSTEENGNCNVSAQNYFVIGSSVKGPSDKSKSKCPTPNCDGRGNKTTGGIKHWCQTSCPNHNSNHQNFINNAFNSSASQNSESQARISELEKKIQELELEVIGYKNGEVFKVNYYHRYLDLFILITKISLKDSN
jgi:hypothetical protein